VTEEEEGAIGPRREEEGGEEELDEAMLLCMKTLKQDERIVMVKSQERFRNRSSRIEFPF
jgi:hypothetical protein